MKHHAKKLGFQEWLFRGWVIEKMETGQWNMRPEDSEFWTDAAETLTEAKRMINELLDGAQ